VLDTSAPRRRQLGRQAQVTRRSPSSWPTAPPASYPATDSTPWTTGTPSPSTAQRATLDGKSYRLADGRGLELGYVSMSRARTANYVIGEADSVDQAVEDLRRDWTSGTAKRCTHVR
jgi:hypothetical protein